MRSSGTRARHQQRQYAARTGHELSGHHHDSRRQHGRGQRLPRRMVFGLMARPERLCDRHALGPGRRRAASVRRTRPATGRRRSNAAPRRRRSAARRFRRRTLSAAAGLPAARLPAATRLLLRSGLRPVLLSASLLLRPVLPAVLVPPLVVAFGASPSDQRPAKSFGPTPARLPAAGHARSAESRASHDAPGQ